MSGGALNGIRVLDLATIYAGPFSAMLLGDYGADVIKVEHPRGDPLRTHGYSKNGVGLWWKMLSRNKLTVSIDFSKSEGQELLRELVRTADVLIENGRTYAELIGEYADVDPADFAAVKARAEAAGIATAGKDPDVVANELFEAVVEDHLKGPIFVIDYPAAICPLTKRKASNPAVAERFELFIQGVELANAYTELNDPRLQEELFRKQLAGLPAEDSMAKMDDDFVRALKHAMPPAGGLGIGIDRLCMILLNRSSIRDVILFPLMRPQGRGHDRPDPRGGPASTLYRQPTEGVAYVYKYLLCWRYLKTRYIALASVISVMLGVATMIVVNSVMAGFAEKMRDRLHGVLADVVVESSRSTGFTTRKK